ncbi:MAG: ABC transporter ATP-binding protein [Chakrabartia sp.]
MSDDLAVWAEDIRKSFGPAEAVRGVSLAVPKGMIYGVLGPNGAGKTTTLRMLLGVIDPDSGQRTLLGTDAPRSIRERIGYLPEERGLYPNMTAREAIAFMGALRGLEWRQGRRRAEDMMTAAGLGHAVDKKIKALSKGMAQLVQLLGSLVHQPDLIVLDEPFSGLDPVNQEHLESLVRAEAARGATILFSTHVMSHAERLCERIAIIAGGKCRFEGTVDDARGLLPMRASYRACDRAAEAAPLLPDDARFDGETWQFTVPEGGAERLILSLIQAGHGVAGLTMQRPGLHDAFVRIVSDAKARDLAEAAA